MLRIRSLCVWAIATVCGCVTTAPEQAVFRDDAPSMSAIYHNAASGSGILRMVTPIFLSTSIPGTSSTFVSFGVLELHFVPEPGTLLLVALGMAALAHTRDGPPTLRR